MLSHRDLTQLAATYMDRHVLTVYLRATVENPADRNRWHAELAQTLQAAVDKMASNGRLAAMFDRANVTWRPV